MGPPGQVGLAAAATCSMGLKATALRSSLPQRQFARTETPKARLPAPSSSHNTMASIASPARSLTNSSRPQRLQRRSVVSVKATYMEFSNQAASSARAVQAQSRDKSAPLQLQLPKEEQGLVAWITQIISPAPAEREPW